MQEKSQNITLSAPYFLTKSNEVNFVLFERKTFYTKQYILPQIAKLSM